MESEGSVTLLGRTPDAAVKAKKTAFTQNIKASSPWEVLHLSRRSSASRVGLVLPFSGLARHAASCSERRRLISAKISLPNDKQGSHNACVNGSKHDTERCSEGFRRLAEHGASVCMLLRWEPNRLTSYIFLPEQRNVTKQ